MRPKTLAHDWCADANCETCSHRHKTESQPVRPTPAVGQVWRTEDGRQFIVTYHFPGRNLVSAVWATVRALTNYHPEYRSLEKTDTYVGQFAGFKIEEVVE